MLFAMCLSLFSFRGKGKNDLQKANLKGHIKSITERYYHLKEKNGILTKTHLYSRYHYEYDTMGNELFKSTFSVDGRFANDTVNDLYKYVYSNTGNILKKISLHNYWQ